MSEPRMARKILVFVIKRGEVNDKLTLQANDEEFRDLYRSIVMLGQSCLNMLVVLEQ